MPASQTSKTGSAKLLVNIFRNFRLKKTVNIVFQTLLLLPVGGKDMQCLTVSIQIYLLLFSATLYVFSGMVIQSSHVREQGTFEGDQNTRDAHLSLTASSPQRWKTAIITHADVAIHTE